MPYRSNDHNYLISGSSMGSCQVNHERLAALDLTQADLTQADLTQGQGRLDPEIGLRIWVPGGRFLAVWSKDLEGRARTCAAQVLSESGAQTPTHTTNLPNKNFKISHSKYIPIRSSSIIQRHPATATSSQPGAPFPCQP